MAYEPKKRISKFLKATSTDVTQVCKCPNDRSYNIKEIFISNVSSNAITYTLTIRKYDKTSDDGSGESFTLINSNTLASNGFIRFDSADIILEREDVLNVEVSEPDAVHVSVFIEEYISIGR